MKALTSQLENIVGTEGVVKWEDIEVIGQQQITQAIAPGIMPDCIVYPSTQEALGEVIACAHHNNWGVLPCGAASKLGWGHPVEGIKIVVSTKYLNRLIEHAVGDLTVTVEAGMPFAQLQKTLATAKQFLPLNPAYPQTATLGGIVACADTGSWRQRYGGVRDMLLGLSFVRADGKLAKAGGRVVKNVAGYDLMKLFTGSFGTLGIISQVTFRVYPLPEASETVVLTGQSNAIREVTKTLLASALTPTAVDLLSTKLVERLQALSLQGFGQGTGLVVRFQSVTASVKEQAARLQSVRQQLGLQGSSCSGADEAELWQKLSEQMQAAHTKADITCKIGVLPTAVATILTQLDALAPQSVMAQIHIGSGLGVLRFDSTDVKPETIQKMRSLLVSQGGFLTILEAPVTLKQQLDVWGYTGNALDLMCILKKQFDPQNLLSSHRFVGGI